MILLTNQSLSAASNLQDSRWEGDAPSSLLRWTESIGVSRCSPKNLQEWATDTGWNSCVCSVAFPSWLGYSWTKKVIIWILGYKCNRCPEIPNSKARSRLFVCLLFFQELLSQNCLWAFFSLGSFQGIKKESFYAIQCSKVLFLGLSNETLLK